MNDVLSFDGEPLLAALPHPPRSDDLRRLRDTVARAHASALEVHHALQTRSLEGGAA
ncbi:hypothetical protein ACFFSW_00665 [Saccharothrix longispora]|uniref:FXSXX-COOH protein n=1 Tax=Saccharothrix longispora TaxID=33920 RepID=A0ABU1PX75_9PSEU|nr:hypothetical protein [Saccharothrix longispora]MDR6594494.1 hypothetical protein [Saccharothrix longispora]